MPTLTPYYLDWSFWAVIVAGIAIVLSQLPPVLSWFKRAKLDLEVYSAISITHSVGNPNLQLHLIITNIGGRNVRVKNINTVIKRDNKKLTSLPAQNYLQNTNSKETLLFTSFSLSPNNEWAHIANFLNYFDRSDEKKSQAIHGGMNKDLVDKKKTSDDKSIHLIEHDEILIQKAIEFFNSKFIWQSGEYTMLVNVTTSDDAANISKEFRFTIFENHTDQLKAITEEYKFGDGIYWNSYRIPLSIILPISET